MALAAKALNSSRLLLPRPSGAPGLGAPPKLGFGSFSGSGLFTELPRSLPPTVLSPQGFWDPGSRLKPLKSRATHATFRGGRRRGGDTRSQSPAPGPRPFAPGPRPLSGRVFLLAGPFQGGRWGPLPCTPPTRRLTLRSALGSPLWCAVRGSVFFLFQTPPTASCTEHGGVAVPAESFIITALCFWLLVFLYRPKQRK